MTSDVSVLGKGIYELPVARRMIRAHLGQELAEYEGPSDSTFRGWVNGRQYTTKAGPRRREPEINRDFPVYGRTQVVSFLELIELHMIAFFRNHNVKWPIIRACAERLVEKHNTEHPFAMRNLSTDGRTIFVEMERAARPPDLARDSYVEDLETAQLVINELVKPFMKKIVYGDLAAAELWPYGRGGAIVLDPARSYGQPIVAAHRVPTKELYDAVERGDSESLVADWFGVTRDELSQAIRYEKSIRPAA